MRTAVRSARSERRVVVRTRRRRPPPGRRATPRRRRRRGRRDDVDGHGDGGGRGRGRPRGRSASQASGTAHWKRAPARVRRWLMPTHLGRRRPSPRRARGRRSTRASLPRAATEAAAVDDGLGHTEAAEGRAHTSPTHHAARPTSSSQSGSSARHLDVDPDRRRPARSSTAPPPLRRRTTSTPSRAAAACSTTSSGCAEPSTSAGRSTSSTYTARTTGGSSRSGVERRRPSRPLGAPHAEDAMRSEPHLRRAGVSRRRRGRPRGQHRRPRRGRRASPSGTLPPATIDQTMPFGTVGRPAEAHARLRQQPVALADVARAGRRPRRCPTCGCRPWSAVVRGRSSRRGRRSTGTGGRRGPSPPGGSPTPVVGTARARTGAAAPPTAPAPRSTRRAARAPVGWTQSALPARTSTTARRATTVASGSYDGIEHQRPCHRCGER